METLLNAIQSNDIPKVKDLLSTNRRSIRGLNFCNVVSLINDVEMLSTLFHICGKEIRNDSYKNLQQSVLHGAIRADKDLKIIEAILNLDEGCINRGDLFGVTPLMLAVLLSKEEKLLKFLLENDADVNVCDKSGKASLLFVQKPRLVKFLIENGAEVNLADNKGFTIVMSALKLNRDRNVIIEFIKNGADVDARNTYGQTCLHLALYFKYDEELIDQICSRTLDYNEKDNFYKTPLCYAIGDDHWIRRPLYQKDFIHELINKSFVMDADVFMYAVEHCRNDDLVSSLLKYVDVTCVGKDGNCVFHHVRDPRRIDMFASRGAPINYINSAGRTPLMDAIASHRSIEIIESLLLWGSDTRKLNSLFSVGDKDKFFLSDDVCDLLVLHGMSVSLKNDFIQSLVFHVLKSIENSFLGKEPPEGLLRHVFLSNEYVEIPDRLMMYGKIYDLVRRYNREINKMKDVFIMDGVSFYNFCMSLYKSDRSPFVDKRLTKADQENIKSRFPNLFNEVIIKIKINIEIHKSKDLLKKLMNVRLAIRREKDSNVDEGVGSSCKNSGLDHDSLYIVGSYMNVRDMNCLINAAIS